MDFSELIAKRYSVRAYKPDLVEDEKLQRILEAARLAPTAANRQPIQIIVIHTQDRKEELSHLYGADWFLEAPILICVCCAQNHAWVRGYDNKNYAYVDAAITMDHLVLAATNEGLGTCWIAAFDPAVTKEVLGLPEGVEPVVFTPLGYSIDPPRDKKRKPLEELVRYEKY